MNLELHILQSFAPSNLNRDDTGSPKDCEFGGVRRARISSQCLKRSVRLAFARQGLLAGGTLALRTRKVAAAVAGLLEEAGRDAKAAKDVANNALAAVGLGAGASGDSEYLLFVPQTAVKQFAEACLAHWNALKPGPESGKKEKKKKAEVELPKEVRASLEVLFQGGKAADLALFGRMIADRPSDNVAAAAQVAHALSTHKVDLEFDFYTAVDDLQPEGETGAGMMGTVEFNAACFYRYANVDLGQLRKNLAGEATATREAIEAFLMASIEAIPSGKQNSMAAQNPPSLVLIVLRESGLWSLANAFLNPVRATAGDDLMTASIARLGDYWGRLTAMYGEPKSDWLGAATLHADALGESLKNCQVTNVPDLVKTAVDRCARSFEA